MQFVWIYFLDFQILFPPWQFNKTMKDTFLKKQQLPVKMLARF